MSNSDTERVECSENRRYNTNISIHTPRPPNLGPLRLPSLTASINTSQWQLSHEERSQGHGQTQSQDCIRSFDGFSQDISLQATREQEEVTCRYPLSNASTDTKTQKTSTEYSLPLAPSAFSGQDMCSNFSGTSVHLQAMRIPQHLRSMSVTSATNSVCGEQVGCSDVFAIGIGQTCEDRRSPHRARYTSSTGFESTNVPFAWGKVVEDNASSVYSARPQSSGRSTPKSGAAIERHSSTETIHFSRYPKDKPSCPAKSGVQHVEATCGDPSQQPKQELKGSDMKEFNAFDGGRSTPSLMKPNEKDQDQGNLAIDDNNGLEQSDRNKIVTDEQKLVKKKSMMQNSTSNLKSLLPRARTRIFSMKFDVADTYDGTEGRRSKRSKSMYNLHTAQKKFKQSDSSKSRPFKDEISALFAFSSPERSSRVAEEEKIHMPEAAVEKTNHSIDNEAQKTEAESGAEKQDLSTQFQQNLGSWNKYPSHTRPERNRNAGLRDDVYCKDFAPYNKIETSELSRGETDCKCEKKIANKKVMKSRVAKSKSMVFGKSLLKNYAKFFRYPSNEVQQHAHGHRSSMSVSGIAKYPELEMISAVFPNAADPSDSSQSKARSRSSSPEAKNIKQVPPQSTARQWSQMYESCVELPRISEDEGISTLNRDRSSEYSEYDIGAEASKSILRGQRVSRSLSGESLRDSTVNLAEALRASEARECAKAMQIAHGD